MRVLPAALLALPLAALAVPLPAAMRVAGEYAVSKEVLDPSISSRRACRKAGGAWAEEACTIDGLSDRVRITESAPGAYRIHVQTVTTAFHTCDFEGNGTQTSGPDELRVIRFQADPDEVTAGEVRCEVDVRWYGDRIDVAPVSWEACRVWCGARATLDIDGAERVR